MEATASAKYLRGSAQKARLVVDLIRGKDVNQALAILRFMRSAIANANEIAEKANISIDPDDLWVRTAFVDRGPTKNRRRVRPAPQGRAYREQRHFCHVTISLSNDERPAANAGKPVAAEAKPAKLAESKRRKRGGAAAAPRAKRVTKKTEETATEKPATKRASKKKAKTDEATSEE
jgi:large subunit ribosomal protein L22